MKFKIRLLQPAIALLAALGLSSIAQAQLLNPGFEEGNGRFPTNWIGFDNFYREPVGFLSGSYSMKLFGNFTGGVNASGAYQNFAISPGQSAAASVHGLNASFDAMSGDNFAILKLIYRDANNTDLVASESIRIDRNTPLDQWQLLTAQLGPAPANTTHGSLFVLFIQLDTTPFAGGAAFFDDATLDVISAVTTGYAVTDGYEAGGGLGSLLSSDNDSLCIFNDDLTLRGQMEFFGTGYTSSPSSLTFTLEYQVYRAGLSVAVDLFKFSNNSWVAGAGGIAGIQTDHVLTTTVNSGAANFTTLNGDLRSRVTWSPINDEDPSQDGWLQCVDLAKWSM